MISKLSGCSRWLPIFRMISKLSRFFQMTANFPDDFKTVRIFQMTANFPDDFKTVRIFQMTGNFPDDFKLSEFSRCFRCSKNCVKTGFFGPKTPFSYISALIDPFYGLFGPFLTLFNTQTPFLALLGEICWLSVGGGWPKDIHYAFFGNVVRGKSALFRLVVKNGFAHFVWKVFARRKLLPSKFWVFAPLANILQNNTCSQLWSNSPCQ